MFIDPKTVSKLVFITGDVSEGSDNDQTLCALIGPHWKVSTVSHASTTRYDACILVSPVFLCLSIPAWQKVQLTTPLAIFLSFLL